MPDLPAILSALSPVTRSGPVAWTAACPLHRDRTPSLSIRRMPDGRVALHCFGCGAGTRALLAALALADDGAPPPPPPPIPDEGTPAWWARVHREALAMRREQAVRRHPGWEARHADVLWAAELMGVELTRRARRLERMAADWPPDLEETWTALARANDLRHEAALLALALDATALGDRP